MKEFDSWSGRKNIQRSPVSISPLCESPILEIHQDLIIIVTWSAAPLVILSIN